tara:strand:+ start:1547 stop:2107 length:561 start_codon:yes stop_codon:yes gene_type:complete
MRKTFLYLKQHNQTGLKYFGKTVKKNHVRYRGSGVHWTRHLDIHGDDVSTLWTKPFTNKQKFTQFAKAYSKKYNIVESKDYANLIPEDGFTGGNTGITEEGRKVISETSKRRRHSEASLEKIRKARAKQKNLRTGCKHSPETIAKIKAARAKQQCPRSGKKHSLETIAKMKTALRRIWAERLKGVA